MVMMMKFQLEEMLNVNWYNDQPKLLQKEEKRKYNRSTKEKTVRIVL